jgi:hypothetical protein
MNFVDDDIFICMAKGQTLNLSSEDVQQIKQSSVDSNKITRMFGPKPTCKEILDKG